MFCSLIEGPELVQVKHGFGILAVFLYVGTGYCSFIYESRLYAYNSVGVQAASTIFPEMVLEISVLLS
jgi:hypothetical protein